MATPAPKISEYKGRTVDHIAFDGMTPERETQLTQALVKNGKGGALVTGIQKLAQRFLIELMTDQGTLRYLPHRGTQFMRDARRGFWRTTADVEQSFYGSLLQLEDNLVGEENVDDPEDEKFGGATLISVSVTADLVVMRLYLWSKAGTAREIIYPLQINSIE